MLESKKSFLVAVLAVASFFAEAVGATDFATPKSYPVGTRPAAIAVGDFNDDGKLDIAVANSGSGNVSILLGNGDGTFQTALNSAVSSSGGGPRALAVGDFNGDNKLDLIVVNPGDPTNNIQGVINLLFGKGDGTFQAPVQLSAGNFPFSVAVGDFNNDHRVDLIVGDQSAGTLSLLLGNGNGTFQAAKTMSLGASGPVNSIVVADFNGDARPDVVAGAKGGPFVLLGNGDGSFHPPSQVASVLNVGAVLAADFNGDHRPDLVVRYQNLPSPGCREFCISSDVANLYLGNGDGTFQAATQATGFVGALTRNLAAADFNGDGKLDLFLTHAGFGQMLLGKGDGNFQLVPPPAPQLGPAIAAADFNGDSLPDLAMTDPANNAVVVVLNNSPTSGADLAVTVNPTQANVTIGGGDVTYTATILNEGPHDSNVTLTEDLPAGWKFVSAQPSQGTCSGTTTISCALGSMLSPSSSTVAFDVTPTTAGTSSDSLTVSGTQPDLNSKNNSATLTVTAMLPANVSIAGSASETSGTVGDKVTISAKITNGGPATATNVVLADNVTDSTAVSNLTISQGSCAIATGQITCTIGTLAPGAMVSMSYVVTLTTPGTFDNQLKVAADQPNLTGSASVDVSIAVNPADLAVSVSLSPNPPAPNANVTATATFTNNGPFAAVSVGVNVGFLPVNIAINSIKISQGTCEAPVDGGITCGMGPLAVGAMVTVTVGVTAPGGGQMTFAAGILSSSQSDPNSGNNGASITVNIATPPDFTVSPASANLTMSRGGQVTDVLSFPAQGGFSGTISLTCSVAGPSPKPTCGIAPQSVTPGNTATLTINAAGLSAAAPLPFEPAGRLHAAWLPIGLIAGVLAICSDKKRRGRWLLCLVLLVATILPVACGGGGSSGGPVSQTFTVTVTATSGAIQHSTTILVTVQ